MTVELNDDNFDTEVLKSEIPVLVDFWAPWCGPCRMIAGAIDEIAGAHAGRLKVGKLNVDENQRTAARYKVMSIPFLGIFSKGELADSVIGAVPRPIIEDKLKEIGAKLVN